MPMSIYRYTSMYPAYDWGYSAYQERCKRDFQVTPRPRWITTEFDGHDIKHVLEFFRSNIIISNCLLGPWNGGSVLENINVTLVAFVTHHTC